MDHDETWRTIDRELVFDASPWVQLFRETIKLPSGRTLDDFYHVWLPDFCVIIAKTLDCKFVMVRGYKHGVGSTNLSPPAGMIDDGEDPLAAAKRELLEETGYQSTNWRKIGAYVTDGNRHCGTMHLFVATDARAVQAPKEDETEPLRCELLGAGQLREALLQGEIGNLPGVAGAAIALLLTAWDFGQQD